MATENRSKSSLIIFNLTDNVPVNEQYRRIPRQLYEEVRNYIDDHITNQWVRKSYSAYANPNGVCTKKDGRLRLCIDYHKLHR